MHDRLAAPLALDVYKRQGQHHPACQQDDAEKVMAQDAIHKRNLMWAGGGSTQKISGTPRSGKALAVSGWLRLRRADRHHRRSRWQPVSRRGQSHRPGIIVMGFEHGKTETVIDLVLLSLERLQICLLYTSRCV